MKKSFRLLTSISLVLIAAAAFAMGGTYGKGDPVNPISQSNWQAGISELANRADRIDGYWINASDWFHYAGDAKGFNKFLEKYAKLANTPHLVVIFDDKPMLTAVFNDVKLETYDWEMRIDGWSSPAKVEIVIPSNSRLKLNEIKFPLNVDILLSPNPSKEIKKIADNHAAAQKKVALAKEKSEVRAK